MFAINGHYLGDGVDESEGNEEKGNGGVGVGGVGGDDTVSVASSEDGDISFFIDGVQFFLFFFIDGIFFC